MTRIDQIEEEIEYLQRIETEGGITNYRKGRLDALKEGLSLVKNLNLLNVVKVKRSETPVCPKCENPYPHRMRDGRHSCEECRTVF